MVKVFCDMCGREIDYEVDGVNMDFNHYGVVSFKSTFSAEKQLCLSCAGKMDGESTEGDVEHGMGSKE